MLKYRGILRPGAPWIAAAVMLAAIATMVALLGAPKVLANPQSSSDASLTALSLNGIDFGTFASSTNIYEATIANRVSSTTVTATTSHSGASYVTKLDGVEDDDGEVSLSVGSNVFTVEVIAEDDSTIRTYTVTVIRAENTAATGAPVINGTPLLGETLTVDLSGIADGDGIDLDGMSNGATYSYVWRGEENYCDRSIGLVDVYDDPSSPSYSESNSEQTSFEVPSSAAGLAIRVIMLFRDEGGNLETLLSAPTAVVPGPIEGLTLVDTSDQSDVAQLECGRTTTSLVTLEDPDNGSYSVRAEMATTTGVGNISWSLQSGAFLRGDRTDPYSLYGEDYEGNLLGRALPAGEYTLQVTVYSSDHELVQTVLADFDVVASASSTPPTAPPSTGNNRVTGTPSFTGRAEVGQALTVYMSTIFDADGLDNVSYNYQWHADGAIIPGATTSSYMVQSSDLGKIIRVDVTFTDDLGNPESFALTFASDVLGVPGAPHSVAVRRGGTGELVVSWEEPDSDGGSAITSYTVQWKESSDSWDAEADVSEATTTATSYIIIRLSLGTEYSVRVIATNSVGDGPASTEVKETAKAQISRQQVATPNNPPAGAPTISGMPEVGQTLSVETSGISDADGLANAAFTYQWIRSDGTTDTDISGAMDSTYTLVSDDEGRTIKVLISFTDDAGNDETLTSVATAAVEAALTAELQGVPSSHNGSGTFTFRILFSEDVSIGFAALKQHSLEVSNATIKRAQRVNGRNDLRRFAIQPSSDTAVVLVLPATEDCDDEGAICTSDSKRLSTRLEIIIPGPANTAATGAPTISGTLEVGQTLTAATSGIGDADGLSNVSFSHQWIANDGATDTDIQGATGSTYTLTESDEGKTIKVRVSFTDDRDNEETLTSAATAAVSADLTLNNPATGAPVINGTVQVGETLTVDMSSISDSNGMNNATFGYQWLADDIEINGATGSTYTLTDTQEGTVIKVRVSFTDDGGNEEMLTSTATGAVEARPNNPATGAPIISGTAQVGETLTVGTSGIEDADGLTDATFSYQWLADDADISGATGSTYTLVDADEGKAIKVRVSFTDNGGNEETLTSEATSAVAGADPTESPPAPTNLTATVNADGSVTLSWDTPDDDSVSGYQILRRRPPMGENTLEVYVEDTGNTDTTYTDQNVTAGIRHVYRVKAINSAGLSAWSNYGRAEP